MSDASSSPQSQETHALFQTRHHSAGKRNTATQGNENFALMRRYDIDLVLDVGACDGQYSRSLIHSGYAGRIISFEPHPDSFAALSESRRGIRNWKAEPFALSVKNGSAALNVTANSNSHSLQNLRVDSAHRNDESSRVSRVPVRVRRLDAVFNDYYTSGDRCYLKLDVRGHEHQVLAGASGCLDRIVAIQMNLVIDPQYEDQPLWQESLSAMKDRGYEMMVLSPERIDPTTGVMVQAEGIFVRREAIAASEAAA
ncbi:FkbM family methyltransferase [Novipirellula sp. SH528]|uniref:FkbM family methyltransferase n=1 Tax=Novipirellula sp. SH528 TaxID=3454466 RepID=UPI003FA18F25